MDPFEHKYPASHFAAVQSSLEEVAAKEKVSFGHKVHEVAPVAVNVPSGQTLITPFKQLYPAVHIVHVLEPPRE